MQSHYVYLIENLVNGKIYVGKHSTDHLDDGYMGSGKLITRAIAKHGLEHFRKRIIREFDASEEAFEFERSIVNEEFVADENTYNLSLGGGGGDFSGANRWYGDHPEKRKERADDLNKFRAEKMRTDPEFRQRHIDAISQRNREFHAAGKINLENFNFRDRTHTQEAKIAIGRANAIHQSGEGNSQFGTVWLHNEEYKNSKRVKKEDAQFWLDKGWILGRKIKW